MAAADRDKALDIALANIEKQYGKGSVMRLGDEIRAPLEVIPTGSIALDIALGLGGLDIDAFADHLTAVSPYTPGPLTRITQ